MVAKVPSAIPVGTQFAPTLISLPEFLAALVEHSGDKNRLEDAVWQSPVRIKPVDKAPTKRRRSLPLEAAVQYGLLEPGSYRATTLARRLARLPDEDLYEAFGQHILLNLGGLRVVEAAQQMQIEGRKVTGDALAAYLTDQGFPVTVHNTAINSMRLWLWKAGVFSASGWRVNEDAKAAVSGLDDTEIAGLVGLSKDQRSYVLALCRVNPVTWTKASELRDVAELIGGHRLDRGNLPKLFLEPLAGLGLIEYKTKGTAGGKASIVRVTDAFRVDVLEPFITRTVSSLDSALTAYFRWSPDQIYAGLESSDVNHKGQALEAFSVMVMRLLGLRFVAWRKRAQAETGRAEIDVVMTGVVGGVPTRWQIQCKNKPSSRIRLEDVAKEVGLIPITKATHVMLIGNCPATPEARTFSVEVMRNSSLTVYILDATDFARVKDSPAAIASVLREKGHTIAQIARTGLDWLK